MRKKYTVLLVYCIYILSLYGLSIHYQVLDELPAAANFAEDFSKHLGYARDFFVLSILITWAFFIVAYFIHRTLSAGFIFLAPVLWFLVAITVYLAADFILWISQLKAILSDYQKGFLITSVSTTVMLVWCFGDLFRERLQQNENVPLK